MLTLDLVRVVALMPARDFESNNEAVKATHRHFNFFYLVISVLVMFIAVVHNRSEISIMTIVSSIREVFQVILIMYILGLIIQVFQCLDTSNQNVDTCPLDTSHTQEFGTASRRPGRPADPVMEDSESPLVDERISGRIVAALQSYGHKLNSREGGEVVTAIYQNWEVILKNKFTKEAIAQWLYKTYQDFFDGFDSPRSMTTANACNQNNVDLISGILLDEKRE